MASLTFDPVETSHRGKARKRTVTSRPGRCRGRSSQRSRQPSPASALEYARLAVTAESWKQLGATGGVLMFLGNLTGLAALI